jgi:large subunit ribosomal protein L2
MPVVSSASRNIKKLTSKWLDKTSFKQLTYRKISKAGRSKAGRIIVWTKSSIKRRLLFPKINYSYRDQFIGVVGTFRLIPFQNKLTVLIFFSSGGVTYLQSTDKFKKVFSFVYFPTKYNTMRRFLQDPLLFTLCYAKPLTKVCLVELFPGSGIQYIRSSGTSALLVKSDSKKHTALLQLPSGVRKSFSLYSLASLGSVSLKIKKSITNTKSGFYRTHGLKPHVRGVAMNPVDHPHGGRAKSIKYPRTPWGKTTKFK